MKKVMSIGMALAFVFFVAPAMATDICPLKSALPEAETSVVQMTNTELSAVRGGWGVRTFKGTFIGGSSISTNSASRTTYQVYGDYPHVINSSQNNQVNNVEINTGTGSPFVYDSRSTTPNKGYRELYISLPSFGVRAVPPEAPSPGITPQ